MKQFTFTSQLAPIIWKYLESRQNEGYTSVHCGYYMQELDCLSKELSDAPVVTKELIDAWDLLKPYLSNRSKIVRHNAIRAFAKFALIPFLTEDDLSLLLSQPDASTRQGLRDLTLLALLYDSGARVQELVDLRLKDVRLTHPPMVILTGKGRKVRQVPLMKDTCKLLDRYIRSFHSDSQSQMIPLFYNAKKQALSRYGVTYILKKYAAKASPVLEPQNISPHVLRHTKAMHLLRAGVNMIYIRDFLGHADISTTEVYARIDAEMKRKVFEEKVPNYTPNTTMPWEEDEDLLQWLTQFGKKTF